MYTQMYVCRGSKEKREVLPSESTLTLYLPCPVVTITWLVHFNGQSLVRKEGKRVTSSVTDAHQLGGQLLQYTGTRLDLYR